jgi:hypothetical protein
MSDDPTPAPPEEVTGPGLRRWFDRHGDDWGLAVEFHSGARETIVATGEDGLAVDRGDGTREFEAAYLDHVATDAGSVDVVAGSDLE